MSQFIDFLLRYSPRLREKSLNKNAQAYRSDHGQQKQDFFTEGDLLVICYIHFHHEKHRDNDCNNQTDSRPDSISADP